MITDFVTLFAPTRGRIADQLLFEDGGVEVLAYSGQTAALKDVGRRSTLGDVRGALRAGGGLVASLGADLVLRAEFVEAGSYKAPAQGLVLSPGGAGELRPIKDITSRPLRFGEHVILPADADAERRLRDFQALLDYLPSDRASLILNLIRRPSIEWRLSELEARVGVGTPLQRESQGSVRFLDRPAARAAAWILAAVIVLAAAYTSRAAWLPLAGFNVSREKDQGQKDQGQKDQSKATALPDSKDDKANKPGDSVSKDPYAAAIDQLVDAMRRSTDPRVHRLVSTHLEDSRRPPEAVAWTLVKLELVRRDSKLPASDPLLAGIGPDATNAARETAKRILKYGKGQFQDLEPSTRTLLAVASCDAWMEPGLPELDAQHPAMKFDTRTCPPTAPRRDDAARAAAAMMEWVRTLPRSEGRGV